MGMRTLLVATLFVFACGGPKQKKESSIVEGPDNSPTCCCKTIPQVGEHEIVPNYNMKERMECSSDHGTCVDDIQCNGQAKPAGDDKEPAQQTGNKDGVPPPPTLGGASAPAVPK